MLLKDADLDPPNIPIKQVEELSKAYTYVRYPDMNRRFYTKKDTTNMLLEVAHTLFLWVRKKFGSS